MNYFVIVIFNLVTILQVFTLNVPSARNRQETSEQCHLNFLRHPPRRRGPNDEPFAQGSSPKPPSCCEIPDILLEGGDNAIRCLHVLHENFGPEGAPRGVKPRNRPIRYKRDIEDGNSFTEKFQGKIECLMSCIFNITGLYLADGLLNEELLNQKLVESIANESRWSPVVEPVFKKCIAAAKEVNSQSQNLCKAGPAEYAKCMNRELFFNCPADMWNNSQSCSNWREQLKKCPNMSPLPQNPPHPFPA